MSRRVWVLAALALLFVATAGLGAYGDWVLWEPYSGLLITLAGGAILLLALVLAISRRSRPLAAIAGVAAVGLLAGQNLGPSRPPLRNDDGRITVSLSTPTTSSGSIVATCSTEEGGPQFQVAGDPNLRLDIVPDNPAVPADIDQREHVGVSLWVGDRWRRSLRADTRSLDIFVGRVEADALESRMTAGPSSTLEIELTADGGSARFAGLVPDTRFSDENGPFIDVGGTIEWTCGA